MAATNFFLRSQDDAYWETYLAARPKYEKSHFYSQLLEHHQKHGSGKFDLAHDFACGPGQVAAELTKHFRHVVASDTNAEHVKVSDQRLQSIGRSNVSYLVSPGEDMDQHEKPNSVDMITVAEAMALVDMPRLLDSAFKVLKPGGTLALWHYGRPTFLAADGESLDAAANEAYSALADHLFTTLIKGKTEAWQAVTTNIHSWFDHYVIPEGQWTNVQRRKVNFDCELSFYTPSLCGLDDKIAESRVGKHEEISNVVDRDFWSEEWTTEQVVTFIRVLMPWFDPAKYEDDEYWRLVSNLNEVMGGKGAKRAICWPVAIIMATKK